MPSANDSESADSRARSGIVIGAVSHPRALPREEGWLLTGGGLDEEDVRRDERQMWAQRGR